MNLEEVREYCLSVKGASECFPFDETTLVFKVMGKMFAYMSIEVSEEGFRINLKCEPEKAIELREKYNGIIPGFHANKKYWNTIYLDSDVPDRELRKLIEHSVEEVIKKLPRKQQDEYAKLGIEEIAMSIQHIKDVESTNSYLREWSNNHPNITETAIYADNQISGRGQRGNSWESEAHCNLTTSILLKPEFIAPDHQFIISQIVSLAIKDTLSAYCKDIKIKWPNDIYYQNKKICGILIENDITENQISRTIIGIGLNVNQLIFRSDAPNPISLSQITGKSHDIRDLLVKIAKKVLQLYNALKVDPHSWLNIHNQYELSLYRNKGFHLFENQSGQFSARIHHVEQSGLLVLERKDDKELVSFAFKEIKYIL